MSHVPRAAAEAVEFSVFRGRRGSSEQMSETAQERRLVGRQRPADLARDEAGLRIARERVSGLSVVPRQLQLVTLAWSCGPQRRQPAQD